MNNYQEIKKQSFYGSIFESTIFGNGIKHCIIKRKANEISNFSKFIIWNTVFFSFFPLASASVASFVDINYKPNTDLYDAILNTFFPIFFVVLLNASGKSGSIKNVILPILDDVLYNMTTWMIPLIVSFAYDDLMSIKIFSIINMCIHVFFAVCAIIKWEKVVDNGESIIFFFVFFFLIFVPVLFIPIFWIIIITHKHTLDSISIVFITLFGICLVAFMMSIITLIIMLERGSDGNTMIGTILYSSSIICFYAPNILQTLLIALSWPINFYFVKACVFILVLSLTRNVSYYVDKVPDDFLATSTTITQCVIRSWTKKGVIKDILKGTHISMEEMHEIQKTMQTKIDEMQTTIQSTTDMHKTMQMKIDEIQKTMNENKR
ncbi:unnamed protein product [Rhizophagus irregularis]|uniref:Uncharacterized protein n=1 Tax=Rhizophagus irregularis TaxID=588596 RepID=A0A2N1NS33_9GLOM|nr:hypothetical protein RhiirC2_844983 [Rhizophagus irregularis]CAB4384112.1 unnamed protein product [Rhizophagus irregularis]CAB5360989.1 unnamed protein product [Rhizophagus irregularis]